MVCCCNGSNPRSQRESTGSIPVQTTVDKVLFMHYGENMKTCSRCHHTRPASCFSRQGDGLQSYCKDCQADSKRAWLQNNPEKHAANKLYAKYRLRPEDLAVMLLDQGNACALCEIAFSDTVKYEIDHDHGCCDKPGSCGECVRGLLCGKCNKLMIGIDKVRSDAVLFERVRRYAPLV